MPNFSRDPSTEMIHDNLILKLSKEISNREPASKLISLCILREPEVISQLIQYTELFDNSKDISSLVAEGNDIQTKVAIIERNQGLREFLLTSLIGNFVQAAYKELARCQPPESEVSRAFQDVVRETFVTAKQQFEQAVINLALFEIYLVTQTVPTNFYEIFRADLEYMLRFQVQEKMSRLGMKLEETPLTPYQTTLLKVFRDRFETKLREIELFKQSEEKFINLLCDSLASFAARHSNSLINLVSKENPHLQQEEAIVRFVSQQLISLYIDVETLLKPDLPFPFPYSTA